MVARIDRDTHQIIQKTEKTSLVDGGPYKVLTNLSCKAGGLQRRRVLKSFQLGVSSHHRYGLFSFFCNLKNIIMFSGIIEAFATVVAIEKDKENVNMTLTCPFVSELKIDQSVAHNGVCLTVVEIKDGNYVVTAMKETLDRSNLGLLKVGDKVNVERSMMINGRLDGHIVQGHVDTTATCISMEDAQGSTYFTFRHESSKEMVSRGYFTVDKGSVTVNGVSLTVCNPTEDTFQVAIIPYTMEHTNFCDIKVGTVVNLEFDILGKYIARMRSLEQ